MKLYHTLCITIFFFLFTPTHAGAQIPNAGFENWANNVPDGWYANNLPPLYNTVRSSDTVHAGLRAARGEVKSYVTMAATPLIQSGTDARGFAFSQRPAELTAYYQFFPAASSGDRFGINAVLYKGGVEGTSVAVGAVALDASVSSYTKATAVFNYITSDTPDTCVIQIQVIGPGTGANSAPHVGSYYLLDDLAFSYTTGVAASGAMPGEFRLDQNFPNPFNPSTTIRYSLAEKGNITLKVHDILGKEVAFLVNGIMEAGEHHVTFNAPHLSSGVYVYSLSAGSMRQTRKFVLMK